MYYYLGYERLQLFFNTPNMLAAFLVYLAGCTLILFFLTQDKIIKISLFLTIMILQTMLIATYSRGGLLAWGLGLFIILYFTTNKSIIFLLICFGIGLFLTPAGIDRVASITHVTDGSILHRLWLWLGGLGCMAKYPIGGCPVSISLEYSNQYMPWFLNEYYKSFLSDSITIGATYGVVAFTLYWSCFFVLVYLGYSLWMKTKNPSWLVTIAVIIMIFFCCQFSTFFDIYIISANVLFFLFLYVLCIVKQIFKKNWIPSLRGILIAFSGGVVVSIISLTIGNIVNMTLPYQTVVDEAHKNIYYLSNQKPIKQIVYFFPYNNQWGEVEKFPDVRYLAVNGYSVYLCPIDSGLEGLDKAKNFLKKISNKFIIFANDLAAANALIAAATYSSPKNIHKVFLLNINLQCPMKELSFEQYSNKFDIPLVLLYQSANSIEDTNLIYQQVKNVSNVKVHRLFKDVDSLSLLALIKYFESDSICGK